VTHGCGFGDVAVERLRAADLGGLLVLLAVVVSWAATVAAFLGAAMVSDAVVVLFVAAIVIGLVAGVACACPRRGCCAAGTGPGSRPRSARPASWSSWRSRR
jgi:uncharacterized membrane protein YhaH (DUF805 family)